MIDLHKLEDYTIESIESFILNEIEESIHIEFKGGDALSKEDKPKKEISKDVSAFANSDGGIIIYGLTEKDHKAFQLSFIDGSIFSKEWIEQVINSSIQRSIPGLKIFPIRKNGDIKKTIYVVQIPSSMEAPHMCKDNRFYKRCNFLTSMMEEYEVRQSYGKKVKSILKLSRCKIVQLDKTANFSEFKCVSGVHNVGETIEENYKINVYLKNFPDSSNVHFEAHSFTRNHSFTNMEPTRFKISATSMSSVYPDEAIDVIHFNFKIKDEFLEYAVNNSSIEFILLYPNGEDRYTVSFRELI